MKKILLTLLAVLMFATAGTANVLAEASDYTYDAYISFGDSITRGLGSEGATVKHEDAEATKGNIRIVKGAYNALVGAEFVGIDATKDAEKYYKSLTKKTANKPTNYYPVAGYGLTVENALDLISKEPKEFEPSTDIDVYEKGIYARFGADGTEGHIRTKIAGATNPLITVNLGLMDVALYSSADGTFQENIKGADEKTFIAEYQKAMFRAYLKWAVNYDKLIGEIVKLRKEYVLLTPVTKQATIALVGFFNPLRGVNYKVSLGEDKGFVEVPIGTILDPIVALMNETSRFLAKKYNSGDIKVVYADVSNGEGYAAEEELAINDLTDGEALNLAVHGTPSTYAYMANQIIKTINGTAYGTADDPNAIVVDLVRFAEPTDANYGYAGASHDANDTEYTVLLDGKVVPSEAEMTNKATEAAKVDDEYKKLAGNTAAQAKYIADKLKEAYKNELYYTLVDTVLTVINTPSKKSNLLQVFVKTKEVGDVEKDPETLYVNVNPTKAYTVVNRQDLLKFRAAQSRGNIVKAEIETDEWGNETVVGEDVDYYLQLDGKLGVLPKDDPTKGYWFKAAKSIHNLYKHEFEADGITAVKDKEGNPVYTKVASVGDVVFTLEDGETYCTHSITVKDDNNAFLKIDNPKLEAYYAESDTYEETPLYNYFNFVTGKINGVTTDHKYVSYDREAFAKAIDSGLVVGYLKTNTDREKADIDFNNYKYNTATKKYDFDDLDTTKEISDPTLEENLGKYTWVKSTPKLYSDGVTIQYVTPVTATEQEAGKTTNVAVLTYVLMYRDGHYEAYNIDTTNSVAARIEKILSPITTPVTTWFNNWYSHTELSKLNTAIADFKDATEAITDATAGTKAAIADAWEALQVAKADYDHCLEAYLASPGLLSKAAYNKAATAYKGALVAYKDAITADLEASKDAIAKAGAVVEEGMSYIKTSTKWAYDYIRHLGD